VDEERTIRHAAEQALNQIDPNWPHSEAARRAGTRLEALLDTSPTWVRSAIQQLLTRLQGTAENLQPAE
jgi:hypothetical protein